MKIQHLPQRLKEYVLTTLLIRIKYCAKSAFQTLDLPLVLELR